jgi:general stress protein 26
MPIGMLTTQTPGGGTHSRPMLTHDVDESGWLWFLTDRHSRKTWELGDNPRATIAFQSPKGDRFISVQGTAVVVRDPVKLRSLWNPTLRSWFPKGRHDPDIVLVAVQVDCVEYWLVPRSRAARVFGALKAIVTGVRHESGVHGMLDLHPA